MMNKSKMHPAVYISLLAGLAVVGVGNNVYMRQGELEHKLYKSVVDKSVVEQACVRRCDDSFNISFEDGFSSCPSPSFNGEVLVATFREYHRNPRQFCLYVKSGEVLRINERK